ncbi:MAG: DUF86 domain-containing protein [Pseudomonadota bacterium]
MEIDKELIQRRLGELLSFVNELRGMGNIERETFKKNIERQYSVMHLLQLSIEATLSIANHIIARKHLGIPNSYQDSFELLERAKILSPEFTIEMKKMARFRNRLVHLYWQIDLDQIYDIYTGKLGDFEEYARLIRGSLQV